MYEYENRDTGAKSIIISRRRRSENAAIAPTPANHQVEFIPEGHLRLSNAIHTLRKGKCGNVARPEKIGELTARGIRRIGYGEWTEEAANNITNAARKGKLPICVYGNPSAYAKKGECEIMPVPASVLCRLVPSQALAMFRAKTHSNARWTQSIRRPVRGNFVGSSGQDGGGPKRSTLP